MILAIDPGPITSTYCNVHEPTLEPATFGTMPNEDLLVWLRSGWVEMERVVIEMIASYGMPVGQEVFDTCVYVGQFVEALHPQEVDLIFRLAVRLHHCGSARAGDANVAQALVDRFAPGKPNKGKGSTKAPGWFHGFKYDIWQAYALAVYAADTGAGRGSGHRDGLRRGRDGVEDIHYNGVDAGS